MPAKHNRERWFVVHDYPTSAVVGGKVYPGHQIKVDDLTQTPVCVVLVTNPKDARHAAERRRLADLAGAAPELLDLVKELVDSKPCSFDHNGGCQAHCCVDDKPGRCPHADAKALIKRLGARKGRRAV